jgi:hypothetical protein
VPEKQAFSAHRRTDARCSRYFLTTRIALVSTRCMSVSAPALNSAAQYCEIISRVLRNAFHRAFARRARAVFDRHFLFRFFRNGPKTCCKISKNAYKYSTCVPEVERVLLDEINRMNDFNK